MSLNRNVKRKGKYIIIKNGYKNKYCIQSAKVIRVRKDYLEVEIILAIDYYDGKPSWKKGDLHKMYMGDIDAIYDTVDNECEVVTRML